jgi:hypothetical protein
MKNFDLYSAYYDLLYQNKPYQDESQYIIDLISKYSSYVPSNMLELGSGSGGHATYFSKSKLNVTGLELSQSMVDIANKKNIPNFTSVLGDISSFSLSKKYDVAVSLFHVISYLTSTENLLSCFKCINEHLEDRGLFIFDCWYSPAVLSQKTETRIKRIESENLEVIRIAESIEHENSNTVTVNFEILIKSLLNESFEKIQESHNMRHFSFPEMELIARLSGFEIINFEEAFSAKIPSYDSWGVCFVLRKIS